MVQLLQLLGAQPILLELSMNPCVQRCEYCYAKMTFCKNEPIDKVANDILRQAQKDNLLGVLLREKHPIVCSNRSDMMSSPNWKHNLDVIHNKLGYPIFLQTKLNRNYKELADVLDKERSIIYVTVTGINNKYEELNLLPNVEKLEALKWLKEQGYFTILAINPIMSDKVTVDECLSMIKQCKPTCVITAPYNRGYIRKNWHLFRPLYPKDYEYEYNLAIYTYCMDNDIGISCNENEDIFLGTSKTMIKEFFNLNTPLVNEAWNNFVLSTNKGDTITKKDLLKYIKQDIDDFQKGKTAYISELIYNYKKKMGEDRPISIYDVIAHKISGSKGIGIVNKKGELVNPYNFIEEGI